MAAIRPNARRPPADESMSAHVYLQTSRLQGLRAALFGPATPGIVATGRTRGHLIAGSGARRGRRSGPTVVGRRRTDGPARRERELPDAAEIHGGHGER